MHKLPSMRRLLKTCALSFNLAFAAAACSSDGPERPLTNTAGCAAPLFVTKTRDLELSDARPTEFRPRSRQSSALRKSAAATPFLSPSSNLPFDGHWISAGRRLFLLQAGDVVSKKSVQE